MIPIEPNVTANAADRLETAKFDARVRANQRELAAELRSSYDWRLSERDGIYNITDVIINGLSMAVAGRSEFEGVAERNGEQPQAILAVMRQECANTALP